MKSKTFKIYKLNCLTQSDNLIPLEVGGNISFMKPVLLNNCQFSKNEKEEWHLKFFLGRAYEQHICVSPNELSFKIAKKLASASFIIKSADFGVDDAEELSMAVRNSKSIKKSDFIEYPSHYLHIDGRGLSFFSHIENQEDNFYRQVLLLSLAYAYLGAIEFITNKLAEQVNCEDCNMDELNDLYIEAAKFNSMFFFHQPILIDKASLTEAWRKINESLEVDNSERELLEQLSNVHYILNLNSENKKAKQDKQKQAKQDKWNLVFAIIGILIGIIELFK